MSPASLFRSVHLSGGKYQTEIARLTDGGQDSWDLGVLVDERQRVGNIAVAEVHNAQANPAAALRLDLVKNMTHQPGHRGARLHPVQPLAGVLEPVLSDGSCREEIKG